MRQQLRRWRSIPGVAAAAGGIAVAIAGAMLLLAGAAAAQQIQVEVRPVTTKPDGACTGLLTTGTQRYVDCDNGTVYDTLSGLLWLRDVACGDLGSAGLAIWSQAWLDVADLQHGLCGLTDHSQPGEWRLPTTEEWVLATDAALDLDCVSGGTGGPPALTDDAGTACYGLGAASSFVGMPATRYWAANSYAPDPGDAHYIDLDVGMTNVTDKQGFVLGPLGIWPVRRGGGPGPPGEVEVDGAVVETRPRPTCLPGLTNTDQRQVDCGDGTVLDVHTDLIWLADASCADLPGTDPNGSANWPDAHSAAMALATGTCGLTDGSQPGDWRLATATEWQDTMARAVALGCTDAGAGAPPTLTDQTGLVCAANGVTPLTGIENRYWTFNAANAIEASEALAFVGLVVNDDKNERRHVWPVRRRR